MATQEISRRQMLTLLGMSAVGAAFAGCGASTSTSTGSAHYQGKFVVMSAFDSGQYAPVIKAVESAHPGVNVVWRNLTSERYTQLFSAAALAGDQIDLMLLNGQDLRRYAVGNTLRDLSDISYKNRFREAGLKTYTIRNKLWALPLGGISGFTFFYNKKLLEKVGFTKEPETYDELLAVAPALRQIGVAPFTHPGQDIYLWPVWQFFAYAQTTGNQSVEHTFKTLAGDMKFTDPEHVAALEILYKYARDKMFVESVNGLDRNAAWLMLTQGNAAFLYDHTSSIAQYASGNFPKLDLSLIPPLRSVSDPSVKRQMPGGTGNALSIYHKIAPERLQLALSSLDLMTSDNVVKQVNKIFKDPVSCNTNVQASDDPLALKYAKECAPNQTVYLDWYWPPEITNAFQQNQQSIVAGTKTPSQAAQAIQQVMDNLRSQGYTFQI